MSNFNKGDELTWRKDLNTAGYDFGFRQGDTFTFEADVIPPAYGYGASSAPPSAWVRGYGDQRKIVNISDVILVRAKGKPVVTEKYTRGQKLSLKPEVKSRYIPRVHEPGCLTFMREDGADFIWVESAGIEYKISSRDIFLFTGNKEEKSLEIIGEDFVLDLYKDEIGPVNKLDDKMLSNLKLACDSLGVKFKEDDLVLTTSELHQKIVGLLSDLSSMKAIAYKHNELVNNMRAHALNLKPIDFK